jgi:hypothetical protein
LIDPLEHPEPEMFGDASFLRSFVKCLELDHEKFIVDYNMPLPLETNRTSEKEVLYNDKTGSAYGIRTRGLLLEREVS